MFEARGPVDPELGLVALVARQQVALARWQQDLEESKAALSVLLAGCAEGWPKTAVPGVEHLEGKDAIHTRMRHLTVSCQWEASSFAPGGTQSAASLPASRVLDEEAMSRGVRLRRIHLDSIRNHQPALDDATWLAEAGGEVRTIATLPLHMLIVDRRLALVPMNTESDEAVAVMISVDGVLAALLALFNAVWKTAVPLGSPRRRDSAGLSGQEKSVLTLLAGGLTDEVIARRLGVSVRTARRVASDLLARLDARSRFQAGVRAAARGWINESDLD